MYLNNASALAKFLLEINAVKLNPDNPFTWTSGIQSPIYCDNRFVFSFLEVREFVKYALKEMIIKHFPKTEMIVGIATGAISHAALVADLMKLPGAYVRPEPKKHGLKNQFEGSIKPGTKVTLVEDLISTGKSSLAAVEAVREAGGKVQGLVGLFKYGFPDAEQRFIDAGVPFHTISNFNTLCKVAAENGYINHENLEVVLEFSKDPQNWRNNPEILKEKIKKAISEPDSNNPLGKKD